MNIDLTVPLVIFFLTLAIKLSTDVTGLFKAVVKNRKRSRSM